tara:strand:+ start:5612 stop:6259 length:648 start_codon:yes stop_codon:yes gene_type:complete
MKYFFFLLIPFFCCSQNQLGISISGGSSYIEGQQLINIENTDFSPVNYEARHNKVSIGCARGRRIIIGEVWLRLQLTYSVINTSYDFSDTNPTIINYETINRSFIPSLELQHVVLRTQGLYVYYSIGSYTIIENLNIDHPNNEELDLSVYEYNGLMPFIRSGLQLSLGRFTINPFIGYNMETIYFNQLNDISSNSLKESFNNGALRTGLEFGVFF